MTTSFRYKGTTPLLAVYLGFHASGCASLLERPVGPGGVPGPSVLDEALGAAASELPEVATGLASGGLPGAALAGAGALVTALAVGTRAYLKRRKEKLTQ